MTLVIHPEENSLHKSQLELFDSLGFRGPDTYNTDIKTFIFLFDNYSANSEFIVITSVDFAWPTCLPFVVVLLMYCILLYQISIFSTISIGHQ